MTRSSPESSTLQGKLLVDGLVLISSNSMVSNFSLIVMCQLLCRITLHIITTQPPKQSLPSSSTQLAVEVFHMAVDGGLGDGFLLDGISLADNVAALMLLQYGLMHPSGPRTILDI
jgi:hypothetical protein